jgi:hypothetical protein
MPGRSPGCSPGCSLGSSRRSFLSGSPVALAVFALLNACGSRESVTDSGACDPWAVAVVDFVPGEGAGYGAEDLPGVVLGPPEGGQATQGALDVVSLGLGGTLSVELGCPVVDGDGPDLFIYENPFVVGGGPRVYTDPARVEVSVDGQTWASWPCVPPSSPVGLDDGVDGCAGLAPVAANARNGWIGTPEGGGDPFDLATLAPEVIDLEGGIRFVRIVDVSTTGSEPNAGFDLDAVASVVR